ncbi:MAG TPA: LysM peptidoglycan-binding domain-containing protein [Ginsengibacter sp.]|nr:LysM peptidoglycan-binding domain-containing protein [Ginsengibacter sp.]
MVKWVSIFLAIFFISNVSFAQKSGLVIEGTTPNLYLIHKVIPKENFYSIGRMYNVSAKELASYNNLQFQNGLSVGESLKIPLTENNFLQSGSAGSGEALIPVYHSVQPKEGLYRVSINFNKVPLTSLKKWNHMQSDAVSVGTPLIVGYLKVNKNESALANKAVRPDVAGNDSNPQPIPPVVNPDRLQPVKVPDADKQEKKEVIQTEEPKVTVTTVNTKSNINFSGGFFKKLYDDQAGKKSPVSASGTAGTFKSTSGWQDGKYYCFNNDAPPGSVIKITDNATNKSVYAKVLDAIPDIKQNTGLTIIISNAAAEELGSGDKFDCALSYVK